MAYPEIDPLTEQLTPATMHREIDIARQRAEVYRLKWEETFDNLERCKRNLDQQMDMVLQLGALCSNKNAISFTDFLTRKNLWSYQTFGLGQRTEGVLAHIEKELKEVRENPGDLFEWVDIVFLALDGAFRRGFKPEEVWQGMLDKQAINEKRLWPAPTSENQAVEHVRDGA